MWVWGLLVGDYGCLGGLYGVLGGLYGVLRGLGGFSGVFGGAGGDLQGAMGCYGVLGVLWEAIVVWGGSVGCYGARGGSVGCSDPPPCPPAHAQKPGTNPHAALKAVYELLVQQERAEQLRGLQPPPVTNSTRHVLIIMTDGGTPPLGTPKPSPKPPHSLRTPISPHGPQNPPQPPPFGMLQTTKAPPDPLWDPPL